MFLIIMYFVVIIFVGTISYALGYNAGKQSAIVKIEEKAK